MEIISKQENVCPCLAEPGEEKKQWRFRKGAKLGSAHEATYPFKHWPQDHNNIWNFFQAFPPLSGLFGFLSSYVANCPSFQSSPLHLKSKCILFITSEFEGEEITEVSRPFNIENKWAKLCPSVWEPVSTHTACYFLLRSTFPLPCARSQERLGQYLSGRLLTSPSGKKLFPKVAFCSLLGLQTPTKLITGQHMVSFDWSHSRDSLRIWFTRCLFLYVAYYGYLCCVSLTWGRADRSPSN